MKGNSILCRENREGKDTEADTGLSCMRDRKDDEWWMWSQGQLCKNSFVLHVLDDSELIQ